MYTDTFINLTTYNHILSISYIYMIIIIYGSLLIPAPYGKFSSNTFGLNLPPKLGWFLMELPATLSFIFFYIKGYNKFEIVSLFFLSIWIMHYSNRGFIFPILMRVTKNSKASFSLFVILSGFLVTSLHGYLNAVYITNIAKNFNIDWFVDPRFIVGMIIYLFGYIMNLHSDSIIRNLRTKKEILNEEKIYRIPKGGLFYFISCPSYFTELMSFAGLSIATWSLGAVFVLIVSAANLIPRAFQVHKWYQKQFGEKYPKRKILIPYIL